MADADASALPRITISYTPSSRSSNAMAPHASAIERPEATRVSLAASSSSSPVGRLAMKDRATRTAGDATPKSARPVASYSSTPPLPAPWRTTRQKLFWIAVSAAL